MILKSFQELIISIINFFIIDYFKINFMFGYINLKLILSNVFCLYCTKIIVLYDKLLKRVWNDLFAFHIASLSGQFLIKLDAWNDRHLTTKKDAADMYYILQNVFTAYATSRPSLSTMIRYRSHHFWCSCSRSRMGCWRFTQHSIHTPSRLLCPTLGRWSC